MQPQLLYLERVSVNVWKLVLNWMTPSEIIKAIVSFKQTCSRPPCNFVDCMSDRFANFGFGTLWTCKYHSESSDLTYQILETIRTDDIFAMLRLVDILHKLGPDLAKCLKSVVMDAANCDLLSKGLTPRGMEWLMIFGKDADGYVSSEMHGIGRKLIGKCLSLDNPLFVNVIAFYHMNEDGIEAAKATLIEAIKKHKINTLQSGLQAASKGFIRLDDEFKSLCRSEKMSIDTIANRNRWELDLMSTDTHRQKMMLELLSKYEYLLIANPTDIFHLGSDVLKLVLSDPPSLLIMRATCKSIQQIIDSWANKRVGFGNLNSHILNALRSNDFPTLIWIANQIILNDIEAFFAYLGQRDPITNSTLLKKLLGDGSVKVGTFVWFQTHILGWVAVLKSNNIMKVTLKDCDSSLFAKNAILAEVQLEKSWGTYVGEEYITTIIKKSSVDVVVSCFHLLFRMRPRWLKIRTVDGMIREMSNLIEVAAPADVETLWLKMDALKYLRKCLKS